MRITCLTLLLTVFCLQISKAQSGGLLIRLRSMQPASDIFNKSVSNGSFGLNLGYSKTLKGGHWGGDITGFFDAMDYNFYIPYSMRFTGYTNYTGVAVGPKYCFNPKSDVQFYLALYLKGGYNWGDGFVYKGPNKDEERQTENKSVTAGTTTAFSPVASLTFPVDFGNMGIELGYDSSDYGRGIRKLRSNYYQPINYHSGYLFAGVFFRLGD